MTVSIFFAIPSHRPPADTTVFPAWAQRMLSGLREPAPADLCILAHCPWVGVARDRLVDLFIRSHHTHLFFRDDDNDLADPTDLQRMIDLDKPIVVAPYRKRQPPHDFAIVEGTIDSKPTILAAGLGLTLIKRGVLFDMIEAYPELRYESPEPGGCALFHHEIVEIEGKRTYLKEDAAFFWRASRIGYDITAIQGVTTLHGGIEGTWRGPGDFLD